MHCAFQPYEDFMEVVLIQRLCSKNEKKEKQGKKCAFSH